MSKDKVTAEGSKGEFDPKLIMEDLTGKMKRMFRAELEQFREKIEKIEKSLERSQENPSRGRREASSGRREQVEIDEVEGLGYEVENNQDYAI